MSSNVIQAVSPGTATSNSNIPLGPPKGPSRFARIKAAKAQAAIMGNTTGSGPSFSVTPQSMVPQQLQPQPPTDRPENRLQHVTRLEAAMTGTTSQQIDPSFNALTAPLFNATTNIVQPIPVSLPAIPSTQIAASHMDHQSLDRQQRDRLLAISMRQDFSHDQQNPDEHEDDDYAQGSSNHHSYTRKPDAGWGQRRGRRGLGYRGH